MIDVCLLGCGGSMPTPERYLTSLLINYKGKKILIDCGEGTQVSMKMIGWGFKSMDIICFTHVHADHIVGLPGLLLTIANSGRTETLTLLGPRWLTDVVKGLKVLFPYLPFDLRILEAPDDKKSHLPLESLVIEALPVDHTTPCLAYSFEIKRAKRFNPDKARLNQVPVILWNRLQKGDLIIHEGKEYIPDMVLGEERKGIKISYCTDSRPTNELIEFVKQSQLLVCEGMYGDDADLEKAITNKHMLFSEAANIAASSQVKELWLTHFSPSLNNPYDFLDAAKTIFYNTIIGEDRLTKTYDFKHLD